ncbi:hypothetical protein EIN_322690, partial [Entamoeba invadens IP1]
DENCETCSTDQIRKCVKCLTNYYPGDNGVCIMCDSTCGGNCDTTNGLCTTCLTNYVFTDPKSKKCEMCNVFDAKCFSCSPNYMRSCIKCAAGYYPHQNGTCVLCDASCATKCNTSTGVCESCINNYVYSESSSKMCVSCDAFDAHCTTCSTDSTRKCIVCSSGYYPKNDGDFRCRLCDTTCGGKCGGTTGMCTGCDTNYVPTVQPSLTCIKCNTFDTDCVTCAPDKRECAVCTNGKYPDETTKTCKDCDSTCNTQCNTTNGICTGCLSNYVFTEPESQSCVSCISFDGHCKTCASDYTRSCIECNDGYYPDQSSHMCVLCNTIEESCSKCSTTTKKCTNCEDPFYISSTFECVSCEKGTFKNTEKGCTQCSNSTEYCQECTTVSVGKPKCITCYPPYKVSSNGDCVICDNNQFYSQMKVMCVSNTPECLIQLNEDVCLKCHDNHFLSNQMCVALGKCDSHVSITSCDSNNQILMNTGEKTQIVNCKYQKSSQTSSLCLNCQDNYLQTNMGCVQKTISSHLIRNNVTYSCGDGEYLNGNECESCSITNTECIKMNDNVLQLNCADNFIYDVDNLQCITDTNCATINNEMCVMCNLSSYDIVKGKCSECTYNNCDICSQTKCMKCSQHHLLVTDNWCVDSSELNCVKSSEYGCVQCNEGFYQSDTKNIEGKYSYCLPIPREDNCKYLTTSNSKCVECYNSYKLRNGVCAEYFDDNVDMISSISLRSNKSSIKESLESICMTRTNKGCQHCSIGYYLSNEKCIQCSNNCYSCYNSTYCISCENGYFLNSQMECKSLGDLKDKCSMPLPTGGGCAICKDGFYKVEKDCISCDESCGTCLNLYQCSSCAEGYYQIQGETQLCLSNTTLSNCIKSNSYGCEMCMDRYHLSNYRCSKCSSNCISCQTEDVCTLCEITDFVLVNNNCTHFSDIEWCLKASNSKCNKCKVNYKPSEIGDSCLYSLNLGIAVGIPISIVIVIIIIVTTIIVVTVILIQRKKERIKEKNVCTFKMDRSNIQMSKLNSILLSNKKLLKFDLDTDDAIPVDK